MSLFTCEYADLQEVNRLASLFLEKLVAASIVKHPRMLNDLKIIALKNSLVDSLALGDISQQSYSFEAVHQRLDRFVEGGSSAFSIASSVLGTAQEGVVKDRYYSCLRQVLRPHPFG